MDTSIFGLRFISNESLQPAPADLAAFLRSPRAPGMKGAHQDDLAVFTGYLMRVDENEQTLAKGVGRVTFNDRMLLGVLSHTRFFRPALRVAVEEYLYHHHQLQQLDFNKPEKFIRSAGEELAKLNPKKRDDKQKIARLEALVEQRKRDLDGLVQRRRAIAGELSHITVYVRDNIGKVRQLCEEAISNLARLQVGGKRTEQLIEDIKEHFRGEVRDQRELGAVTPEYLESVKAEVADLSLRLKRQLLGDVYAVTGIYEAIYDHVKNNAALLTEQLVRAERARRDDTSRDNEVFGKIERTLIALISEFKAEAKAPAPERTEKRLDDLLWDKRREMLDYVFTLLKERKTDAWTI
jgi:hypothetical protein